MGGNGDYSETSLSLLQRLKTEPSDGLGWAEFVQRYEPRILDWCRRRGLQSADASDVTQNVLLKIAKHMSKFEYRDGGGFRKWLRTVAYHAWCDHLANHKWTGSGGDAMKTVFESVEARDSLLDVIEQEYSNQVFEDACTHVKSRVEPHIWNAFEMMARHGKTAQETASELNISVGNAYVSKSRVQKMLADEVARIESAVAE